MAQKRTIDIDINTNADEAAKQFETLSTGVKKAADSAENLDAKFEDVFQGVEPLTTRLGEAEDRLYELALAGDTTSKEYQELLTKVGEYRKVQIQTDLAVDQAAQTFSQKLGTALGGATSGFAVVQGTMALVGSESQALEKTLLKVQAALSIQQGVQGVLEYSRSVGLATKATKLWNLALKANPIGLVITAVVGLIAAVGTLTSAFNSSADAREKDHEAQLKQIDATKKQIADRQKQLKLENRFAENRIKELELDRELATNKEEIAAIDAKIIQERLDGFERERQAVRANQEQAIQDSLKQQEKLAKQLNDEDQKFFNRTQERVDKAKQSFIQQIKFTKELQKQLAEDNFQSIVEIDTRQKEFEQSLLKESIDEEKEANEKKLNNYKDYLQARLSAQRFIEDLQFAIMEEGVEKEVAINNAKFDRMIEDALKNEKFTEEEKAKIKDLLLVQQFEKEDALRKADRDKRIDETFGEIERLELVEEQKTDIVLKGVEKRTEGEKKYQKDIQDMQIRNKEFAIQATLDTLNLVSDITELFGKKGEKQAKRAFQVQKAAQIAGATIETFRSAQSAYLSQFVPAPDPSSPVRGSIAAGIAVAAGLTNVAKIASQKFEGGGASGGSSFSGGSVGGGEAQAPSFNVVGDSGINQLAQLQQAPVQAFVVSGEVTTSQALDRNRVENATL